MGRVQSVSAGWKADSSSKLAQQRWSDLLKRSLQHRIRQVEEGIRDCRIGGIVIQIVSSLDEVGPLFNIRRSQIPPLPTTQHGQHMVSPERS
jgi:hypothetical protein